MKKQGIIVKLIDIDNRVQSIEENMIRNDAFQQLINVIEKIASSLSRVEEDVKVINHRTERIEKWVTSASKKIGIRYQV